MGKSRKARERKNGLSNQTSLQAIMIGLLLAGSCLGVFRMLAKWKTMKRAFPAVVAILLVLFGLLTAIMVYAALLDRKSVV